MTQLGQNPFALLANADDEVEEGETREEPTAAADGFQVPKEQKRKQKKLQRQVQAGKASSQQIRQVLGSSARAEVEVKKSEIRGQLKMRSATDVVMFVLTSPGHPESARFNPVIPNWLVIKNKPLVERVVVLLAPGLDEATFRAHAACLPNLARIFPAAGPNGPVPMRAPGTRARISSPAHALIMYPVKKRSKRDAARAAAAAAGEEATGEAAWGPEQLLATRQQLEENNFPLFPLPGAPQATPHHTDAAPPDPGGAAAPKAELRGYVQTRRGAAGPEAGGGGARLLALDCEMARGAGWGGLALARWTLVDEAGRVVADELVKPAEPVTDYNTRWSGITAEMLRGVTRTLGEAREAFLAHVDAATILVGHSLENDLHALKVVHERVVDTSLLFEHPRGPPYKSALRHLASKYLEISIQDGTAGHDSAEDARAAMRLVKLKLEKGARFGEMGQEEMESVFRLVAAQGRAVSMYERPAAMRMWVSGTAVSAVPCHSDAEVASRLARDLRGAGEAGEGAGVRGPHLCWAHLQDLNTFLNESARTVDVGDGATLDGLVEGRPGCHGRLPPARPAGPGPTAPEAATPEVLAEAEGQLAVQLELLDARVGEVHAALPPNALLLLCTGHGNMGIVSRLAGHKAQCEKGRAGDEAGAVLEWTERHEQALAAANQRAGNALCFVAVK
eukprot:tig00000692_g3273.t1